MGHARWIGIAALLAGLIVPSARGDIVETKDGKRLEGDTSVIGGGVMVKTADGPVKLKIEDITSFSRTPTLKATDSADPLRGLMLEAFSDTELKTSNAISLEPGGAFDWGHAGPTPYTPNVYSVRITGYITIAQKGVYRFRGDALTLLKVGDQVVGKDPQADERGVALEANQRLPVVMEFRKQKNQHARASILWYTDDMPLDVIPARAFTPPDDFFPRLEAFHQKRLSETFGGLKGEYFSDPEMKRLAFTRLDPGVVLMWGNPGVVDPSFKAPFAARWTGRLKSPKTGTIKFGLVGSGRLWIGGKLVVDNMPTDDKPKPDAKGSIDLKENEFYDLKLEFFSGPGFGQVKLVSDFEFAWMPPVSPKILYPPADVPRAHIVIPLNEGEVDATHGAPVRVVAIPGKGSIKKVEIVTDEGKEVLAETTKAPYELTIRPKFAADLKLQARVTNSQGAVAMSDVIKIAVNGTPGNVLGGHWSLGRVGNGAPPEVSENGSRIELTGKSGGFGDQSSMPLVSRMLPGDGELIARLVALKAEKPETVALGGLTLRRGMRADAPHITLVGATKNGWFVTNAHRATDIGTYVEKPLTLPVWIRVARSGANASAYFSADGKDWTLAGSLYLGDDRPLVAGVTAFSLTNEGPVTAVFENVAVRGTESAELATGPGVQLTSGAIALGALTIQDDNVIVRTPTGQRLVIPRAKVARLFYGSVRGGAMTELAPGWRGAVMANDRLEGAISDVTPTGATVTNLIFGPQQVSNASGLTALIFNEVTQDPRAIVVRHPAGQSIVSALSIDVDKVLLHDPDLGDLKLPLSDIQSIRHGE